MRILAYPVPHGGSDVDPATALFLFGLLAVLIAWAIGFTVIVRRRREHGRSTRALLLVGMTPLVLLLVMTLVVGIISTASRPG